MNDVVILQSGPATARLVPAAGGRVSMLQLARMVAAQLLYEETPESVARRAHEAEQRKAQNLAYPDHRPNKKERRQIHRFQDSWKD